MIEAQAQLPEQVATMAEPAQARSQIVETPKTLDEYAKAILEAHQSVEEADRLSKQRGREAIAIAIRAGEYLIQAKLQVGHGNWEIWVEQNCTAIKKSTVERYMRLAKTSHVKFLGLATSLRQAYIVTGILKPEPQDVPPPAEPENEQPAADDEEDGEAAPDNGNEPPETPQTILGQLESRFTTCKSLYARLLKASPELENELFDTCEPDGIPLPILLEGWRESVNDALSYFNLPIKSVHCVGCGHVKEAGEAFGSVYPNTPPLSGRQEWCPQCMSYYSLWIRQCQHCGADLDYGMENDAPVYFPPLSANQYKAPDCSPALKKKGDDYTKRFPNEEAIARYVNERHNKCPFCGPECEKQHK